MMLVSRMKLEAGEAFRQHNRPQAVGESKKEGQTMGRTSGFCTSKGWPPSQSPFIPRSNTNMTGVQARVKHFFRRLLTRRNVAAASRSRAG